jgi:WD40 repeat protein
MAKQKLITSPNKVRKSKTRNKNSDVAIPGFKLRHVLPGQKGSPSQLVWSPNGRSLAACLDDGTIYLWDPGKGRLRTNFRVRGATIKRIVWSPDGRVLAGVGIPLSVQLCDAESGQPSGKLRGNAPLYTCVAWSPDGQTIVGGGSEGSLAVWDVKSRQLKRTVPGYRRIINALSWSPDGSTLAVGGVGSVTLWDVNTWERIRYLGRPSYTTYWVPQYQTAMRTRDAMMRILVLTMPSRGLPAA